MKVYEERKVELKLRKKEKTDGKGKDETTERRKRAGTKL